MHETRSTLTLLEAGDNPLELDAIKVHLRVDSSDDDDLIEAYADAALAYLDGRDGILGRALLTQQWRLTRERFFPFDPCERDWNNRHHHGARRWDELVIPLPPLKSVESVKYLDGSGALQTIDPAAYRIVDGGGFQSSIIPVVGACWPPTLCAPDAVRIEFTAGYDDVAALNKERKSISQAMLLLIENWYENREAALVGDRAASVNLPFGVEALLAPHRLPVL